MSGPYVWAVNGSRKKTAALISLEAPPAAGRPGNIPPGRTLMAVSLRAPRYIPMTDCRKLFR